MTFRGQVKNGVAVFEGDPPPDGTRVQIEVVATPRKKKPEKSVWDALLKLSGKAKDLPPDAARNYKHYLYGHPKK